VLFRSSKKITVIRKDITKKYTLEKTFKDIIQKQDCP